jgi:hypothetical protein
MGESDSLAGLDDSGLHTAHGQSSDSANLVYILERGPEGLIRGMAGRHDGVHGLERGLVVGRPGGVHLVDGHN